MNTCMLLQSDQTWTGETTLGHMQQSTTDLLHSQLTECSSFRTAGWWTVPSFIKPQGKHFLAKKRTNKAVQFNPSRHYTSKSYSCQHHKFKRCRHINDRDQSALDQTSTSYRSSNAKDVSCNPIRSLQKTGILAVLLATNCWTCWKPAKTLKFSWNSMHC